MQALKPATRQDALSETRREHLLPRPVFFNHRHSRTRLSTSIPLNLIAMNGLQLRDEAVRDRIRAAQEFLDPG
jgi:hypothetical protein